MIIVSSFNTVSRSILGSRPLNRNKNFLFRDNVVSGSVRASATGAHSRRKPLAMLTSRRRLQVQKCDRRFRPAVSARFETGVWKYESAPVAADGAEMHASNRDAVTG